MIINFITDIQNSSLLHHINKIFKIFLFKYNSGYSKKYIHHYLHYDAPFSNFNIFYGYINNLLLDKSYNNIFIYIPDLFSNSWIPQLNLYNYIIVFEKEHLTLDYFSNLNVFYIDFYNPNISIIHQSFFIFLKNITSIKIPSIKLVSFDLLPYVSICILTYNRPIFPKLFIYHYNNINYPLNKLEFIIIDDGDIQVKNLLPSFSNIKYFKYTQKNTIGWKRNQAIIQSKYDIIAFMDDDDFYPSNSLLYRISYLIFSNKQCLFCSTIGCYHLYKDTSIIHSTSIFEPLENKVSEATLTFYKSFWLERKFNNNDFFNEGKNFILNRTLSCIDISFKHIIIQLLHNNNTIQKNIKHYNKNGFIFNYNKNILHFILSLK